MHKVGTAPILIAEIGLNHNGLIELAKETINAAVSAGANYVKFQHAPPEDFDSSGMHNGESLFDLFKRHEFSLGQWQEIKEHCELVGIPFFVTTVSARGVKEMVDLGVCALKVASDMIFNTEMIKEMHRQNLPIVISMGHVADLNNLHEIANPEDLILHCESQYPCIYPKLWKIRAIQNMGYTCGYSNHVAGKQGVDVCIRATELGAVAIEVHFTLEHEADGPDHWWSLDTTELKQLKATIG